jgi:hypothetical protein
VDEPLWTRGDSNPWPRKNVIAGQPIELERGFLKRVGSAARGKMHANFDEIEKALF